MVFVMESWHQKSHQKKLSTSKCCFSKNKRKKQDKIIDFSIFGGRSWDKSNRHRSKIGVKKGRHLGIDFSSILVDLGSQVGRENRSKIGPKTYRKIKHFSKASWKPLGSSWTRLGAFGAPLPRPARGRRGAGAGADGVPMPPGAATIKEYQFTRHQYWITRHAVGQRPGEF